MPIKIYTFLPKRAFLLTSWIKYFLWIHFFVSTVPYSSSPKSEIPLVNIVGRTTKYPLNGKEHAPKKRTNSWILMYLFKKETLECPPSSFSHIQSPTYPELFNFYLFIFIFPPQLFHPQSAISRLFRCVEQKKIKFPFM